SGALVGCVAQEDRQIGRTIDHEDAPRSLQNARQFEELGIDAVANARNTDDTRRKREYYDEALVNYREARQLYENELLDDRGTPEKQENLRAEIDRLSDEIERITRVKPS
ncbi:hypothetical protein OAX78_03440, partial [Planctomycetota bacterium]|nr:hypothetical protein [Planctomycetota bacterium]